jgi:CDP-diacylglycerol--serine O-phosphatidyltransferase
MMPVVVMLSVLMVSSIRFDAIPAPTIQHIRAHPTKTALYVLAGLVILGGQALGLVLVLAVYLGVGVGQAAYRLVEALATPAPDEYVD